MAGPLRRPSHRALHSTLATHTLTCAVATHEVLLLILVCVVYINLEN